ncbi:4-hydroxythreonine-4-phosphate dehydrogenase PdxA [Schnuerera sp. xch1]|uniref:4-hydroxythreonine-4-phosphate dehydrogenase PdxA n=1 Tax=Schnuerera sp. xch1 TaxID=2874283 RepID=UPI001CBD186E|nr:4-hydroxythreonine-4-phosphate dehydrogenase PdxA [Schnuerera sp. xch1]MBZ2174015.1 4-hydroxythreonine-4-phosphate dehydrogenase PdxA [Schnuerera sp. xch1]
MTKPIIGISLGDPSGIGPEIVAKALSEKEIYDICNPFLVGDKNVIEKAIGITESNLKVNVVEKVQDSNFTFGTIDMINLNNVDMSKFHFGQVSAMCGRAAFEYIKRVVELAMDGEVDAIATTPINKESLRVAKVPYIGHTEILADLSGVEDPLTMFEVRNLRVFFLTRHMPLREACEAVTYDRVLDYIIRSIGAMKQLNVEGTLAVAGLNPHSGEHGLFGNEEVEHVAPAIEEAKRRGYDVAGPIGADSVFHQALNGKYAAVLSLYHDQGHIATKTLDFERTISITNSMPFLRTSVDHGTAFDIAGKNIANAISMIEAIKLAAKYAPFFTKNTSL